VCGKRCVAYCPPYESPVCGTDNVTYQNECKLHKMNCKMGKKVKVAKRSKCDRRSNKTKKEEIRSVLMITVGFDEETQ